MLLVPTPPSTTDSSTAYFAHPPSPKRRDAILQWTSKKPDAFGTTWIACPLPLGSLTPLGRAIRPCHTLSKTTPQRTSSSCPHNAWLSRGPRGALLALPCKQRDTRDRRLQAAVRQRKKTARLSPGPQPFLGKHLPLVILSYEEHVFTPCESTPPDLKVVQSDGIVRRYRHP